MAVDPEGVPELLSQLQFSFENIPPLSAEEMVLRWLNEHEQETESSVVASLFIADNRSRRHRTKRWMQVRAAQAPLERESGWLIPGGMEASWLYDESCFSYVNGIYLAALLCAHASCERVLAGCLLSCEARLPKGWSMWGLGKLAPAAQEFGLIDASLTTKLHQLSDIRKVSAHFKPPMEPNSIASRAFRNASDDSDASNEGPFDPLLQTDALIAITSFIQKPLDDLASVPPGIVIR
jgi:hypothetical protein